MRPQQSSASRWIHRPLTSRTRTVVARARRILISSRMRRSRTSRPTSSSRWRRLTPCSFRDWESRSQSALPSSFRVPDHAARFCWWRGQGSPFSRSSCRSTAVRRAGVCGSRCCATASFSRRFWRSRSPDRTPWLVIALLALAATAIITVVATTFGALVGLLLLVAPVYGLVTIGRDVAVRRARWAHL